MVQPIKLPDVTYADYNERLRIPEQAMAEELMLKHKHFVLGFEPGKGKSYPVIHATLEVQKLKGRPISVLIMSDATCIKTMWKAEIMVQKILPEETYFVTDRTAIGAVKDALVAKKWDVIIVDECQSLRSGVTRAKSKYARLVYQLTKKAEYVFGMTGTISGNNTIEPWCVLHNLNVAEMGKITPAIFKKTFCVMELQYGPFGAFHKPTKLNQRGEELMLAAYQRGVMFWPYDENDDMPDMTIEYKEFNVPASPEYINALDGILQLGDHESTTLKAIALQKAQQALNGFIYFDNYENEGKRETYYIDDYVNPKLQYIVDSVMHEKSIVGYRFQEDYLAISTTLDNNLITHTTDIETFKQGNHQVLILQASRGKAANIQISQNIIYYTADFSFIAYKQFIHRTWRRGQTKPCKVTFLINNPGDKHEVEFKIWKSLQTKQSIHDTLMSIKNLG